MVSKVDSTSCSDLRVFFKSLGDASVELLLVGELLVLPFWPRPMGEPGKLTTDLERPDLVTPTLTESDSL